MRAAWLALAALVLGTSGLADAGPASDATKKEKQEHAFHASVQAELVAVFKTQGLLATKLATREAEMKKRVRAIYKLSRASFPRLWVEPEERRKVSQWLGAARKIAMRDQYELRLLHEEVDVANTAEARLKSVKDQRLEMVIERKSLRSPLKKTQLLEAYGDYKGPTRRVRLRRRGVELKASEGEEVFAPAAGRILYTGPISGLGQAIVLEHEGFSSIIGHVTPGPWQIGDAVAAEAVIARAAASRLYLELRMTIGSVGQTIDPMPLLRR